MPRLFWLIPLVFGACTLDTTPIAPSQVASGGVGGAVQKPVPVPVPVAGSHPTAGTSPSVAGSFSLPPVDAGTPLETFDAGAPPQAGKGSPAAGAGGGTPVDAGVENTDSGTPDSGTEPPKGKKRMKQRFSLSSPILTVGDTLVASVTFTNDSELLETILQLVITTRGPGATHEEGPFTDMTPISQVGSNVLLIGRSIGLTSQLTFTAQNLLGTWEAYPTYQELDGTWVDGDSVFFTLQAAPLVDAGPVGDDQDAGL